MRKAVRQLGRIKFKFCKVMFEVAGFKPAASSGWQVEAESDNKTGQHCSHMLGLRGTVRILNIFKSQGGCCCC